MPGGAKVPNAALHARHTGDSGLSHTFRAVGESAKSAELPFAARSCRHVRAVDPFLGGVLPFCP